MNVVLKKKVATKTVRSASLLSSIKKTVTKKAEISIGRLPPVLKKYEIVKFDEKNDDHMWILANGTTGVGSHRSILNGKVTTYIACHADIMRDMTNVRQYVGGFKRVEGVKGWYDLIANLPVYKPLLDIPGHTLIIHKDHGPIGYTVPDEAFINLRPSALITAFMIDLREINEYPQGVDVSNLLVKEGVDGRIARITGGFFRGPRRTDNLIVRGGYGQNYGGGHQSLQDTSGYCLLQWGVWMRGDVCVDKKYTDYRTSRLWQTPCKELENNSYYNGVTGGAGTLMCRLGGEQWFQKMADGEVAARYGNPVPTYSKEAIIAISKKVEEVIHDYK